MQMSHWTPLDTFTPAQRDGRAGGRDPGSVAAMEAALFMQSLWIGLAIAAPVGPIGVLVIQRTLRHGVPVGLATGLGAAVADAAYGAAGAFGVSGLIGWLQGARVPLALGGGAFLLLLAWRTWQAVPPAAAVVAVRRPGLGASFAGTLLLTLSNPATILSFVAVFGALAGRGAPAAPWLMVAGVLAGSALWWLLLCAAVGVLRGRFDAAWQRRVSRVSALMLAAFALWQWGSLLAR
jgi:threonine/homoserine/homoserine lactone efflux protein